ncbi:MAG: hypothetical protein ABIH23_22660 [bacterium]
MRHLIVISLTILIIALIIYVLIHYVFISEETRIERQIEKGRKAVENESILSISSLISENYRGEFGQDRSEFFALIHQFFQHVENSKINIVSREIDVIGNEAVVSVHFTLSGTINGQPFTGLEAEQMDKIRLRFVKQDGSWKVVETAPGNRR